MQSSQCTLNQTEKVLFFAIWTLPLALTNHQLNAIDTETLDLFFFLSLLFISFSVIVSLFFTNKLDDNNKIAFIEMYFAFLLFWCAIYDVLYSSICVAVTDIFIATFFGITLIQFGAIYNLHVLYNVIQYTTRYCFISRNSFSFDGSMLYFTVPMERNSLFCYINVV